MKSFPIVILGGRGVAGCAAKLFVAPTGKKGAGDMEVPDDAFDRKHGIALFRNFPVGNVDFRHRRLQSDSCKV